MTNVMCVPWWMRVEVVFEIVPTGTLVENKGSTMTYESQTISKQFFRIFLLAVLGLGMLLIPSNANAGVTQEFPFVRGDCNQDGIINISDGIFALTYLFNGGDAPTCENACDANDDGSVDISDALRILNALFVPGTPAIPAPNECGYDPTPDGLSCAMESSACPAPATSFDDYAFTVYNYNVGGAVAAMKAEDVDGDSNLDLIVARPVERDMLILYGNGGGHLSVLDYTIIPSFTPLYIDTTDFDGDGRVDILAGHSEHVPAVGSNWSVGAYLQMEPEEDGDVVFGAPTHIELSGPPTGVFAGEVIPNGNADVLVSSINHNMFTLARGNGDGTFGIPAEFSTEDFPLDVFGASDVNNDGLKDIIITHLGDIISGTYGNTVGVRLGDPNDPGSFGPPILSSTGSGPAQFVTETARGVPLDFNNDGNTDMVLALYADDAVEVLYGQGDGTFLSAATYSIGVDAGVFDVAVEDLNADGALDLVAAASASGEGVIIPGNPDGTFSTNATSWVVLDTFAFGNFVEIAFFATPTSEIGAPGVPYIVFSSVGSPELIGDFHLKIFEVTEKDDSSSASYQPPSGAADYAAPFELGYVVE